VIKPIQMGSLNWSFDLGEWSRHLGRDLKAIDPRTRRDFFDPKRKKLKSFGFLGEIFQTQTKDG